MKKSVEDLITDKSFLQHVLNPEFPEYTFWIKWAEENEENAFIYEEAKAAVLNFYNPLSGEEYQRELASFNKKIESANARIIGYYDKNRTKRNRWYWYAAAILLFFLSALYVVNRYGEKQKPGPVVVKNFPGKKIKREAGKGQKLTIIFRDGSRVKLNSESYIIFPESFSAKTREVTLSGEAFFEITPDKTRPFIVKTKNVQTTVLGTTFNITSYPDEPFVKVALIEGKVLVKAKEEKKEKEVRLIPEEMAKIDSRGIKVVNFDITKVTAWKDNKIVFDRATFDEVQATLERWYNVKFICRRKPVFNGGYTGEFKNLSLDMILKGMSTNKFKYRIDGKTVYIN